MYSQEITVHFTVSTLGQKCTACCPEPADPWARWAMAACLMVATDISWQRAWPELPMSPGSHTERAFMHKLMRTWNLSTAAVSSSFSYGPPLKWHFRSWVENDWLGRVRLLGPQRTFSKVEDTPVENIPSAKPEENSLLGVPPPFAAPFPHNEEIIFYNVRYKRGNGLNYLSLRGLPFLWNIQPN